MSQGVGCDERAYYGRGMANQSQKTGEGDESFIEMHFLGGLVVQLQREEAC